MDSKSPKHEDSEQSERYDTETFSAVSYINESKEDERNQENESESAKQSPKIESLQDKSDSPTSIGLTQNQSEDDLNQLDDKGVQTSIRISKTRKSSGMPQRSIPIPSVTSSVELCDQTKRLSMSTNSTTDTGISSDTEFDISLDDYLSFKARHEMGGRKVSFKLDSYASKSILNQRSNEVIFESPADEWEAKHQIKEQRKLNKTASRKIKAGWRVRKSLHGHESNPGMVDKFYLENVQFGKCEEIQALFMLSTVDNSVKLNEECTNQHGKRALKLAMENQDVEMCRVLLRNKVQIRDCLFYAIEQDFYAGVEVILSFNSSTNMKTSIKDYHFQCCMTPMMLAAHQNNYEILELLAKNGHQFENIPKWEEGILFAWESAQERRMYCKAAASPAYIALLHKIKREDPMEYCMTHIRIARMNAKLEPEFSSFYKEIICQLEQFMCTLLDQIRSTCELAELFEYDFIHFESINFRTAAQAAKQSLMDVSTEKVRVESLLYLLDKACKEKLVSFVSHQNAQLTIAYMQYRYLTFIRKTSGIKRWGIRFFFGLIFPLLSMFYVIAPNSTLGSLLTIPTVSFDCHIISELTFICLLIYNTAYKNLEERMLGSPPTVVEWLIFTWVMGKWVQEVQEMYYRGFRDYIKDWWNYNDLGQLMLLSTVMILRAISYTYYNGPAAPPNSRLIPRFEWPPFELRLVSEGLTAWAYVLVFLRILAIIRAHKVLGPLQISLTKMLINVIQFLTIFVLIMFSFALGLSELYWYYGTEQARIAACNSNSTCRPRAVLFSNIGYSLSDLFWTLFGYIDINGLSLPSGHVYTEAVGYTLLASYHVVAIIVLLNMLIAMMTKSYEDTSANEENEWKFHRTALWVRFIKREVIRPPPMNLIPNPYRILRKLKELHIWIKKRIALRRVESANASLDFARSFRLVTGPTLDGGRELLNRKHRRHKYRQVLSKLINRYKYKVLFSDESVSYDY